jgi:hypothetical protein
VSAVGGDEWRGGDAVFGVPGSGGEVFLTGVPETRTINCRVCANWRTGYPVLPLWRKGVMLWVMNVTLPCTLRRKRCSVLAGWRAVSLEWRAIFSGWRAFSGKGRAVFLLWHAVLMKWHAFLAERHAVFLLWHAVSTPRHAFFWLWGAVLGLEGAVNLAWPAFCGGGWGFPAPGAACLPLQFNLEVSDGAI